MNCNIGIGHIAAACSLYGSEARSLPLIMQLAGQRGMSIITFAANVFGVRILGCLLDDSGDRFGAQNCQPAAAPVSVIQGFGGDTK